MSKIIDTEWGSYNVEEDRIAEFEMNVKRHKEKGKPTHSKGSIFDLKWGSYKIEDEDEDEEKKGA